MNDMIPKDKETEADFVNRFMEDDSMRAEYPDPEDRLTNAVDVYRNEKTYKGVSILTIGEAKGHNEFIDETTLKTALEAFNKVPGVVKVKLNHSTDISSIIGYMTNAYIDNGKLRANLHIFRASQQFAWLDTTITRLSHTFGTSMHFTPSEPEIKEGRCYIRVCELHSIDIVDRAAANESLYSEKAFLPQEQKQTKNKEYTMTPEEIKALVAQAVAEAITPMQEEMKALQENMIKPSDEEPKLEEGKDEEGMTEEKMQSILASHREQLLSEISKSFLGSSKPASVSHQDEKAKEKQFSELVKEIESTGKTQAQALREAVSKYPKAYSDWKLSGKTL